MRLVATLADSLFPPLCPVTGAETSVHATLSPEAWAALARLEPARGCGTCGRPIPGHVPAPCAPPVLCESCHRWAAGAGRPWERGAAAMLYEGTGRDLVRALKERDRLDLVSLLAGWMGTAAPHLVAEADVIAPVPLAWSRLVARRFNQASELARAIATQAGRPAAFAPRLLRRTRRTPRQTRLPRAERTANVEVAFAPGAHAGRMPGTRVLLIDDVMTTGATLAACTHACLAAGASAVDVLVSALVPEPETAYLQRTDTSEDEG